MEKNVNMGKRVTAYLLDILLIYFLVTLVISIRAINPTYDKYLEYTEKYNDTLKDYQDGKIEMEEMLNLSQDNFYYINRYSISYNIVIAVVLIGYFVFFQKYNNGQTLGKKIMKIKVVSSTKKDVSLFRYLLRSLCNYYLYIGSIIPLLLNSILLFIIPKDNYMIVSSSISYIFLGITIISVILLLANKDSLHDRLAKTKVVAE